MAAALCDAAPPRACKQHDDLSGDEEEEGEGEEGEYRAASELSSPNPHSLFGSGLTDPSGPTAGRIRISVVSGWRRLARECPRKWLASG